MIEHRWPRWVPLTFEDSDHTKINNDGGSSNHNIKIKARNHHPPTPTGSDPETRSPSYGQRWWGWPDRPEQPPRSNPRTFILPFKARARRSSSSTNHSSDTRAWTSTSSTIITSFLKNFFGIIFLQTMLIYRLIQLWIDHRKLPRIPGPSCQPPWPARARTGVDLQPLGPPYQKKKEKEKGFH